MSKIDLTGQKFGSLVVLKEAGRSKGKVLWSCRCGCGNKIITQSYYLRIGDTKSCGCLTTAKNIKGKRFGKLVVIKQTGRDSHCRAILWSCRCDCGKMTITRGTVLRYGKVRSCGCLQVEAAKKLCGINRIRPTGMTQSEYSKQKSAESRKTLDDKYVRQVLRQTMMLCQIVPRIIQLKREQLLFHRELKYAKEVAHGLTRGGA